MWHFFIYQLTVKENKKLLHVTTLLNNEIFIIFFF